MKIYRAGIYARLSVRGSERKAVIVILARVA